MELASSQQTHQKNTSRDFPGGAVVKNLPGNAGDMDSNPGSGRAHVPRSNKARAPQLLSLRSRAHNPQLLKPAYLEPMLPTREATAMRSPHTRTATKSSPCLPQLEKACMQQRRPNAAKNKLIN